MAEHHWYWWYNLKLRVADLRRRWRHRNDPPYECKFDYYGNVGQDQPSVPREPEP